MVSTPYAEDCLYNANPCCPTQRETEGWIDVQVGQADDATNVRSVTSIKNFN